MEPRTVLILLLCFVSAAVLVTGCTSETPGTVTTSPATTVPPQVSTQAPTTIMTTGTQSTIRVTETLTLPETSIPTTITGTPAVSPTDVKNEKVVIKAKNFAFDKPRITVSAGAQVRSKGG